MEFDDSGTLLLYTRIDDTKVEEASVKYYDSKDPLTEKYVRIPYPKVYKFENRREKIFQK